MNDYRGWATLREIDVRLGLSKGSAFRAFKSVEPTLAEGSDYLVLRAVEDAESIAALRAQQRIYTGSINVVLLSAAARERVSAAAQ